MIDSTKYLCPERDLAANYKWFRENLSELLKEYNRKWIVIFKNKVVYTGKNSADCQDYILDHNMIGRASIQFCSEK